MMLCHAREGEAGKTILALISAVGHELGNGRLHHLVEEQQRSVFCVKGIAHAVVYSQCIAPESLLRFC